jgi:glycosyltransferase involved in cell wall biosynthesis
MIGASDMKIAVVIATLGRPEIVTPTLLHLLRHQSRQPDQVIVSCTQMDDAGDLVSTPGVSVVLGPKGLCAQRNTALSQLHPEVDIVVFFDDDFVASPGWIASVAELFAAQKDIAAITGHVIADGIKGPGISFEEAAEIVAADKSTDRPSLREPFSPYGCNMAFRRSALGTQKFDERLVLYGWLEDRDFSARVGQVGGRLVKYTGARGVHMGVKRGRVSGDRLGYSQIVNPLYLLKKGSMTRLQVADHIGRNVLSNLSGALFSEPYIDRRGRLRGNLRGLRDVFSGALEPERAAQDQPVAR